MKVYISIATDHQEVYRQNTCTSKSEAQLEPKQRVRWNPLQY